MTYPALEYKKNALFMEGADLQAVAEKFGTPLYCYSATRIEENFKAYDTAMRRVTSPFNYTICYACKANNNLAVLRLLRNMGAGADIVSGGELLRALTAGIAPEKIVFSGVGKAEKELQEAIRIGIRQINIESAEELEIIDRLSRKMKKKISVAFRVNPDVSAKTHKKISTGKKEDKFGIDMKHAPALYKRALSMPYVAATGISVHIGSQIMSVAPYRKAYLRVAELVNKLRRQGNTISTVDLGGGIGVRYKNEKPMDLHLYALMIRDVIMPLNVHVILEPGRSLTADAGILLSRVRHIKHGTARKFLILDAAMNDLMRPALYEAYHAVLPCKKGGKPTTYDVVGPVCETGDLFLSQEKIPAVAAGDLVAIMTAGAYGATMSSNYNTRPLVPEVLIRDKKTTLVRKGQKLADIIQNDIIPKDL